MGGQGRFKAIVSEDGEVQGVTWDPRAESDDTGTQTTTYGTSYVAWAATEEKATADALEYWRRATS